MSLYREVISKASKFILGIYLQMGEPNWLMEFPVQSPNAKQTISPADRELLEQYGAAVVECSWVRVAEVPWAKIGGKCERLRMWCCAKEAMTGDTNFPAQCRTWLQQTLSTTAGPGASIALKP